MKGLGLLVLLVFRGQVQGSGFHGSVQKRLRSATTDDLDSFCSGFAE